MSVDDRWNHLAPLDEPGFLIFYKVIRPLAGSLTFIVRLPPGRCECLAGSATPHAARRARQSPSPGTAQRRRRATLARLARRGPGRRPPPANHASARDLSLRAAR